MVQETRLEKTSAPRDAESESPRSPDQDSTEPPAEKALASMLDKPETAQPSPQVDLWSNELSSLQLRGLAALALSAVTVGQVLAPALPGSASGIGPTIARVNALGALLTQFYAFSAVMLTLWLLLSTLRQPTFGIGYRFLVFLGGAAVASLVVPATTRPLEPAANLGLALASASTALAAAPGVLSLAPTRVAGLALVLTGISAATHGAARIVALDASAEAMASSFRTAQFIETAAFFVDFTLLALATAWLATATRRAGFVIAAVVVAISSVCAVSGLQGSAPDASLWQVLATRSLAGLMRDPAPVVPEFLRYATEVWALAIALWALLSRHRAPWVAVVLAFCVLSRGATDIPVFAVMLVVSALLARLSLSPLSRMAGIRNARRDAPNAVNPEPDTNSAPITGPEPDTNSAPITGPEPDTNSAPITDK